MRITDHFDSREFDCHDGTEVPDELFPAIERLCLNVLEPIRCRWGSIVVVSGYRTPAFNARCGGARASQHLTGRAADIRPIRVSDVPSLTDIIETMISSGKLPDLGGFGKYRGWVHVDTFRAADGHVRKWHGTGWGSEP